MATDQKVRGSNPLSRAKRPSPQGAGLFGILGRLLFEPLTFKREAFFERSGVKLRSKARSGRLRRGSNPLSHALKEASFVY